MVDDEIVLALKGALPLSERYPYAAWVGAYLRERKPEWWAKFAEAESAAAALPLAQAADFAFMVYCEATEEFAGQLQSEICAYFAQSPQRQREELFNTSAFYAQEP